MIESISHFKSKGKRTLTTDMEKWKKDYGAVDIDDLHIEPYDETDYAGNNELDGYTKKNFCRCKSTHFYPLFMQLKADSSCSYITYANDVIVGGDIPGHLSVLVKKIPYSKKKTAENEIIVPKVLNYFSVPTVFNLASYNTSDTENNYIVSVDAISPNERFYTFEDLGAIMPSVWGGVGLTLENPEDDLTAFFIEASHAIDSLINNRNFKTLGKKKLAEYKEELLSDLAMTLLLRVVLLGDIDFAGKNMGILINTKSKKIKLLNFDFEYCLQNKDINSRIPKILSVMRKRFPREYDAFIKGLSDLNKQQKNGQKKFRNLFNIVDDKIIKNIGGRINNVLKVGRLLNNSNIKA